ncbi:hypothetical protein Mnod_3028 [Methylobacterium nodulans ORS 2060]|uniref:Sulfur globule protein n=1 Tax=Methylobacterium nodulans (strain LMG 21967 / CNCM I-2342 / ORS 2060) TaxID=460265 RepID=B8IIA1_METNO|nr:hypothetical protein Mnod_3028 [Methylobacterium nodulans ORS 2060]
MIRMLLRTASVAGLAAALLATTAEARGFGGGFHGSHSGSFHSGGIHGGHGGIAVGEPHPGTPYGSHHSGWGHGHYWSHGFGWYGGWSADPIESVSDYGGCYMRQGRDRFSAVLEKRVCD